MISRLRRLFKQIGFTLSGGGGVGAFGGVATAGTDALPEPIQSSPLLSEPARLGPDTGAGAGASVEPSSCSSRTISVETAAGLLEHLTPRSDAPDDTRGSQSVVKVAFPRGGTGASSLDRLGTEVIETQNVWAAGQAFDSIGEDQVAGRPAWGEIRAVSDLPATEDGNMPFDPKAIRVDRRESHAPDLPPAAARLHDGRATRPREEPVARLCAASWVNEVRLGDLRFRAFTQALLEVAGPWETVGSVAARLNGSTGPIPPSPKGGKASAGLEALAEYGDRLAGLGLADELRTLVEAATPPRHVELVIARLGWSGLPPASLAEVGANAGISRQRAHQVVARSVGAIEGASAIWLPALDRAIDGGIGIEQAAAASGIHPDGLAKALRLTGRVESLELAKKRNRGTTVRAIPPQPESGRRGEAELLATRLASRFGLVSVAELATELESIGHVVDREGLRDQLSSAFQWYGDDWFAHCGGSGNNLLVKRLQKMALLQPGIPLSLVHHALARVVDDPIPLDVLTAFAADRERVQVRLGGVWATDQVKIDDLLTGIEIVLKKTFEEAEPVLSFNDLAQGLTRAGYARGSLAYTVAQNPLLIRLGRSSYTMIGQPISLDENDLVRVAFLSSIGPRHTAPRGNSVRGFRRPTDVVTTGSIPIATGAEVATPPRDLGRVVEPTIDDLLLDALDS
jgi:hypothetical protein